MKRIYFKRRGAALQHKLFQLCLVLYFAGLPWHAAEADATTEAQLRAALQQATQQIASLENQVANLQAAQAPDVAMINALQAQVQALKQQGAKAAPAPAQTAATDKQDAALKRQIAGQEAELAKLVMAYNHTAGVANANAAANVELTKQVAALHTQNDSCKTKNTALFKIGNQILGQLARRDTLWSGFSSVEPFVGIERVKLQNIVQDDQNKLLDNQDAQDGSSQ